MVFDPYDGVILENVWIIFSMIEQRECVWVDDTRALWAGYTGGLEVYVLLQPIFTAIYHNLTFFFVSIALLVTLLHQPTARIPPGRGTGQINLIWVWHFPDFLGFLTRLSADERLFRLTVMETSIVGPGLNKFH